MIYKHSIARLLLGLLLILISLIQFQADKFTLENEPNTIEVVDTEIDELEELDEDWFANDRFSVLIKENEILFCSFMRLLRYPIYCEEIPIPPPECSIA